MRSSPTESTEYPVYRIPARCVNGCGNGDVASFHPRKPGEVIETLCETCKVDHQRQITHAETYRQRFASRFRNA